MNLKYADRMLGEKNDVVKEALKLTAQPDIISFAGGLPAPESFPLKEMAAASQKVFEEKGTNALQYSSVEGLLALREKIAKRMSEYHNIHADAANIMITSGSQQAIDMVGRIFLNPGDYVVCESPTYTAAVTTFKTYQCNFLSIDTDEDGMMIEDLEAKLADCPNAKVIYVIPNFQNPSGRTMSLERRKAIYAIASKYNLLIYEDDPYGDVRFTGEDVPSFKSFDVDNRVLYVGSFSKTLSAGLRVGYIYGPVGVMKSMVAVRGGDGQDPLFNQKIIMRTLKKLDFEEHLANVRKIYGAKASLMQETLTKYCAPACKVEMPEGGMFAWVTMPEAVDLEQFSQEALSNGIAVVKSGAFAVDEANGGHAFRLNFSAPKDADIVKGCEIFGRLTHKYCK